MEARPLVSLMKVVFFLAAISVPLLALAEPGDPALAQAVRRQPGSRFYARSGVDPSTVTPECQSVCTPIITTLDVCTRITRASLFIDIGTRRIATPLLRANAHNRTSILLGTV